MRIRHINEGNLNIVEIGQLVLYFSYETIIAFMEFGMLTCCENIWSRTTGKHINRIQPNKKLRSDSSLFKQELENTLKKYKIL